MQLATIDQISILAERVISETENLPAEQKKKRIIDEVYELLILAYLFGTERAAGDIRQYEEEQQEAQSENPSQTSAQDFVGMPSQEAEIKYSPQEMYEAIYKPVAGETFEERIGRRLREGTLNEETLQRIMETDYHRCEETGAYNTAVRYGNEIGKTPYKIWRTMQDERVRDQHWWSEGQTVPIDGLFTMPDGAQAPYPGMFGIPDQDCNCRCWVAYTFR